MRLIECDDADPIDAVLTICAERNLDLEHVGSIIKQNKRFKALLAECARGLKMLKT